MDIPGIRAARLHMDGFVHPDFLGVAETLRHQLAGTPGGAAACVYHRGVCVADLWGGSRDDEGRPWERDTMAPSFSTTKGVVATLLHVMVDRGHLDYDDPVAKYWPEFAQAGKERITVRHVLAHQSGLYHIRQMVDRADRMLDWDFMIRAIERATPLHPPGAQTGYHGLTFGFLVGELIRRVSGRRLPDVVREELAEPLGLDGLFIGAPRAALPRAAKLLWRRSGVVRLLDAGLVQVGSYELGDLVDAPAALVRDALALLGVRLELPSILDALAPRGIGRFRFDDHAVLMQPIPAANGLFTARALARLYAVLAEGGSLDGVRLLSPRVLGRAIEIQSPPKVRVVIPFDMRWRLGYHGVLTSQGVPRHAFGHFGFGGSGAWADPSRRLAVGLIVNSGLGTPFGDSRIMRIGGAALACARARRPDDTPDGRGRELPVARHASA